MAASGKELEERLEEAGNELLSLSSSVEELLSLLDKVHACLSTVEQSPPISMQKAMAASRKALVADNLLKHPDEDVKVGVAASISEVTRITAPDAPYEDEQMKAVFQLIVSSFENLFDMSSRSYAKRTSILETVAKVRSCVVMLDLECDALVTEMFRHFLKAIRDYHPEKVFTSMETIMTLVIEESEDISPELLTTILDHVAKDNEEVLPISCKLAEGVLQSCATKLKPYLIETVKSMELSLDNYSNLVASICQGTSVVKEQNDIGSDKLEKVKQTEVATPEKVDVPNEGSTKSVVRNGVVKTGDHSLADSDSTKKQQDDGSADEPKKSDILSEADLVKKSIEREGDIGDERKSTTEKDKKDDAVNQTESSKSSNGEEMESKILVESKDGGKDLRSSPQDDPSANTVAASENEKKCSDQVSPSKQVELESADVSSPSSSKRITDEKRPKKAGNQKKKSVTKENKTTTNSTPRVASETEMDSEPKSAKKSGKKGASGSSNKTKPTVGSTKKVSGVTSKSKTKLLKSEKEEEQSDDMEEFSKQEDTKVEGRGKINSSKGTLGISSKDEDKEMVSSSKTTTKSSKDDQQMEESPKENSNRKRSLGKEKASGSQEYGENLIGSRIKVYWPIDRSYYEGVVDSYDAAKKRHLVLYDDGDQEILYLKKQKWEFIQDDSGSAGEEAADTKSPESKSEPSRKKAKTGSGNQLAKPGKTTASAKRGGGAASGKSKSSSAAKSGKNSKDGDKTETKSKEASTMAAKMDTDSDEEATDDDQKLKSGGVSKSKGKADGEVAAKPKSVTGSKASGKSKEETPKSSKSSKAASIACKTKPGKPNRSGGKSKSAAPSKEKESLEEDAECSAEEDTPKLPEATSKGKSAGSAKGKGGQARWGKKRKR